MRSYDAHEWQFGKTSFDIKLTSKDFIQLDVVSTGTICIDGETVEGETMPIICQQNQIHVKHKFNGFTKLTVHSNKPMGFRLVNTAKQVGEPMDDRTPPPPKEPTNILQQMRSVIKQELNANRESFLVNDTGLPGYETDDEDNFEEEQFAIAQQAKQELVDKSKSKTATGNPPASTREPTNEPEPEPAPQATPAS